MKTKEIHTSTKVFITYKWTLGPGCAGCLSWDRASSWWSNVQHRL